MNQENSPALLTMRGITKTYGGAHALNNVDFHVNQREIVALIGENGAGKSTLMKVLGGLVSPDSGQIVWNEKTIRITSVHDADKLGIAFIHQELSVLDNLDIASNVFLGREPTLVPGIDWVDSKQAEKKTRVLLEQLGLNVSPRTPVSALSIAQKQMVEIARALSQNAKMLIMDEPTASLTPGETDRLLALVKQLRDEHGATVVFISHRLGEVEAIADRVVVLRDGQNAGILQQDEITRDAMVHLMVGRDLAPRTTSIFERTADARPRLVVDKLCTPRYPSKPVSFSAYAGEVFGFAGLVGAGRTEVVQALFGTEPALSGSIVLDGKNLKVKTSRDAIDAGIYLIPEDRRGQGLILDSAIRDNQSLPSLSFFSNFVGWVSGKNERKKSEELCQDYNVRSASKSIEANVGTLSGGNQQKVVISKWTWRQPKVLIFDEPTRGVDVGAKAEIYERIRQLVAVTGATVIVVSSDMEEVLLLCDRVAVMHEGTITGILEHDQLNEEDIMHLATGLVRTDAGNGKASEVAD